MKLFAPFRPDPAYRTLCNRPSGASVRVRWLGTAGHVVETDSTTVLLDPFLTRPSLLRTALMPLRPDPDAWWAYMPPRVDAVLLGHSHYDHLMDAPAIALRTGAQVVGSRSTAAFALASGVPPSQVITIPPDGGAVTIGDITVTYVPSLHGRIVANRVPFPGESDPSPTLPARLWHYRMGGAFGIHLRARGLSLYHNGSADLIDARLAGLRADVLLVGLAGRRGTRDYVRRLTTLLAPSLVIPTHHDGFFAPMSQGVHLLPGIDLDGFTREVSRLVPAARLITPTYDDVAYLPVDASAADTVLCARGDA